MNKYFIIIIIGILSCLFSAAQTPIFTIAPGTTHVIKSGTVVSMDGLVLTPSKDFSLTGKSLTHNTTASNTTTNTNINNYYAFNAATNAFTGAVKFNYSDAELNGLNEANLKLNVYVPHKWVLQQNTSINTTDNFAQSSLSAVTMKELTLGYAACVPTAVVASNTSQSICSNTSIASISLSDANNRTGTTFSWTRSNTGNVTGIAASGTGSIISGSLVNTTALPQTTVFTITANRTNGCPSTTTATVVVAPQTSITTQPANLSRNAGQTAIFTINTSGPVTRYQWQQQATSRRAAWTNINDGGSYSGATTAQLTITNVSSSLSGYKYRCVVYTPCNTSVTSTAATLTVARTRGAAPTVTTEDPIGSNKYLFGKMAEETISLEAYPNPNTGKFNLVISNYSIGDATIRVVDARGRVIHAQEIQIQEKRQTVPIVISNVTNGSYVVHVSQSNKTSSVIVIKQ
jgi:hypothetical protein